MLGTRIIWSKHADVSVSIFIYFFYLKKKQNVDLKHSMPKVVWYIDPMCHLMDFGLLHFHRLCLPLCLVNRNARVEVNVIVEEDEEAMIHKIIV